MRDFFTQVYVINLRRRPDRLAAFQHAFASWPFRRPTLIEAVDGWAVNKPSTWESGSGSYGCQQSHLKVLRAAVQNNAATILVLEDDAIPCPQFTRRAVEFLSKVPDDWDMLMLGGQHWRNQPTTTATPGIVKCINCHRTHAYAVRQPFVADLYRLWDDMTTGHIDHVLGPFAALHNVYAPDPFLIGQSGGQSDITCRAEPLRFWSNATVFRPRHKHVTRRHAQMQESTIR